MKTLTGFALLSGLALWMAGCSQQEMKDAAAKAEGAANAAGDTAVDLGDKAHGAMNAVGEEFTAASDKASEALKGVEGGGELLTKIKELFASATKTLSEVKDEPTATAAAPKLAELSVSAESLKPLLDKLPEAARGPVVGLIEKGMPKLKELAAKVLAIPGVETVLKPKLDELMGKLTGLTGKPM